MGLLGLGDGRGGGPPPRQVFVVAREISGGGHPDARRGWGGGRPATSGKGHENGCDRSDARPGRCHRSSSRFYEDVFNSLLHYTVWGSGGICPLSRSAAPRRRRRRRLYPAVARPTMPLGAKIISKIKTTP